MSSTLPKWALPEGQLPFSGKWINNNLENINAIEIIDNNGNIKEKITVGSLKLQVESTTKTLKIFIK